jgi:FtsH-binding integral membrane protein
MVSFIISCFVVSYIIGPVALVILRRTKPDVKRNFRLPMANTLCLIAFYICNMVIFWTGWQTVYKLMIALAIGFLVFCYHYMRGRFKGDDSIWKCALWLFPYLIGMCIISYLGTFGHGTNVLPFGMDFGVIAVFSLATYYLAMKTSEMKLANNQKPDL